MIFYLKERIFNVWSMAQSENFIKNGFYAFYSKDFQFNIYSIKQDVKKIFSEQHDKDIYSRRYNYGIENGKLLFSLDNELRELDLTNFSSRQIYATTEERITLLNNSMYLVSSSKEEKKVKLINRKKNEIIYIWEDNKNLLYYKNDIYLFCTGYKGDLFRVDIKTDKVMWKMKLGDMFIGNRFFKEYNNDLIIWIQPHSLISINKNTGTKNWELPEIRFEIMEIDEHTLCTFSHFHYVIIDLKKATKKVIDIKDELSKFNLRYMKSTFKNGKIYFSTMGMTKIGVFNIKEYRVEWFKDLAEEIEELDYEDMPGLGLDKPIVHENKIYVRDSQETLWIFEKQ